VAGRNQIEDGPGVARGVESDIESVENANLTLSAAIMFCVEFVALAKTAPTGMTNVPPGTETSGATVTETVILSKPAP
jgi:hypothetical protein